MVKPVVVKEQNNKKDSINLQDNALNVKIEESKYTSPTTAIVNNQNLETEVAYTTGIEL